MSQKSEKLFEDYYGKSDQLVSVQALSFSLGGLIKGVGKVAGIIKAGGKLIEGVSGIVRDIFGNGRRIDRGFSNISSYLKTINNSLDNIKNLNRQIYRKLEELEENVTIAIVDAVYLDDRHKVIENQLAGIGKIDMREFSGALFNLAVQEYRPSKISQLIYGLEGFIAIFSEEDGQQNFTTNRKKAIELVLSKSKHLEHNFIKFKEIHEQEIELLVGQLMSYHKVSAKINKAYIKKEFEYTETDDYVADVENINDFDLIEGKENFAKEIYELHRETKDRIKVLVESRRLYIPMVELITEYNFSLEQDYIKIK